MSTRILDDADWLSLLRRSATSEFGPDGRGPLEYLVPLTAHLAREDRSGEISAGTARRWLAELDSVADVYGFRSGPTCQHIAAALHPLVPAPVPVPVQVRVLPSPDELVRPLDDVEWLALLDDDETDAIPIVRSVLAELVEWSPQIGPNQVGRLWFGIEDVFETSTSWRPGPLLTRVLAQTVLPPETTAAMTVRELDELRTLAGLTASDDPTAPWFS